MKFTKPKLFMSKVNKCAVHKYYEKISGQDSISLLLCLKKTYNCKFFKNLKINLYVEK